MTTRRRFLTSLMGGAAIAATDPLELIEGLWRPRKAFSIPRSTYVEQFAFVDDSGYLHAEGICPRSFLESLKEHVSPGFLRATPQQIKEALHWVPTSDAAAYYRPVKDGVHLRQCAPPDWNPSERFIMP